MRFLLYTDPHICTNSSIIVGKMDGQERERYSARLDRCISTLEWLGVQAASNNVDRTICLGDLVDQPRLTAEELSAISESYIYNHQILVGNHDVSSADGYFNSCNLYGKAIREVKVVKEKDFNLIYLPWSREIQDLDELCKGLDPKRTVILSHNDIKGIYYGSYLSQDGYDIDSILRNCRYFINGHLHVGKWIYKDRILNLGTITGLNFNNVGGWTGFAVILDTDKMTLEWLENPYAFMFHDKKISSRIQLSEFFKDLDKSKCNVVQLRVPKNLVEVSRELIGSEKSIAFSRILTTHEKVNNPDEEEEGIQEESISLDTGISVFDSLREFIKSNCSPKKYDVEKVLKEVDTLEGNV